MELLDIINENNELTGKIEDRKTVHEKSLWHRHVTTWIMNKNGEVLLQKRSPDKESNPNKWAKTGGHVESGEDIKDAIQREVKEEIGIEIPKEQIQMLDIYKSREPDGKYYEYNFLFFVDYNIDEYKLQKEEVSAVKYFSIEDMEQAKKNNDVNYTFYNWQDKDFYEEMAKLKEKRDEILGS